MEIYANKISYDLTSEGAKSILVCLYGTDNKGNFVNSNVNILQSDLPANKNFGDMTQNELTEIAKNKLARFTAGGD